MAPQKRAGALADCRALANEIYPGLDLSVEIEGLAAQGLGETVLVYRGDSLRAFAICHTGKGSEAGSGNLYIKFGAVRPGPDAAEDFKSLLDASEAVAAQEGLTGLLAGTNTARTEAYRLMLSRGFRPLMQGVAMQRPNVSGTLRPDCFVIDDWR